MVRCDLLAAAWTTLGAKGVAEKCCWKWSSSGVIITEQGSKRFRPTQPIGIFDSGVGGLTVYKAIRKQLPLENIVYLGDTARIPYGTRSHSTVRRYALEDAEFLLSRHIKLLVVACNTASSVAIDLLHEMMPVPVIGMIEPGARRAVTVTRNGRIGVIGTEATVESSAYTTAIRRFCPDIFVTEFACPLFVPLAEEGWASHRVAELVAEEYLKPLCEAEIDTLVLGCTHYPILRPLIQRVMGPAVTLVDSGESAVEEVMGVLKRSHALTEASVDPTTRFCVTDSGRRFRRIAEIFLGQPMEQPETVDLWGKSNSENRIKGEGAVG